MFALREIDSEPLYQRPTPKRPALAAKPATFTVHKHMCISVQPNCRLNS